MKRVEAIDEFLNQEKLAVVGASQDRSKTGNTVLRKLIQKGITAYPVNPNASEVEGIASFASVKDLPEGVGGIVLVVPPSVTDQVVQEALDCGIERIWMQPGAESEEAIKLCEQQGVQYVDNECIMFKMIHKPSIQ